MLTFSPFNKLSTTFLYIEGCNAYPLFSKAVCPVLKTAWFAWAMLFST